MDVDQVENIDAPHIITEVNQNNEVKDVSEVKPKKKTYERRKKTDPKKPNLREYVKNNGLSKEFKEQTGILYGKANMKTLNDFIDAHKLELSFSNIFPNESNESNENKEGNECNEGNERKEEVLKGNTVDDDLIENIQFKKPNTNEDNTPAYLKPDENLKLNHNQHKIKLYIDNFPHKVKSITSRPGFAKEFAQVKEEYKDEQGNEIKCPLVEDIERALGTANTFGIIQDKALLTIQWIEDFCAAVRRHKSVSEGGKIPDMVKSTIGNLRLDGWHDALDKDPNFHDCVKELLIKYGSNIEELLGCLSVETRLMMILVFHAYTTHKGNVFAEEKLKNVNVNNIPGKYNGL